MTTKFCAVLALAIATTGLPALAANLVAENPRGIADFLVAKGYRAELKKDDVGDPLIASAAAGSDFSVFFYGCTNGADCKSIQFAAGFDLAKGTTPAAVNAWNAKNRYGKAYLDDENDPYLEMDVNMEPGGMPEDLFGINLAIWESASGAFQTHVGW